MDNDIVRFYEKQGHHIHKLTHRRPSGIPPDKVLMAAEKVYRRIQAGQKIRPIMLAREVWRVADDIPDEELNERLKRFTVSDKYIKELMDISHSRFVGNIMLLLIILVMTIALGG